MKNSICRCKWRDRSTQFGRIRWLLFYEKSCRRKLSAPSARKEEQKEQDTPRCLVRDGQALRPMAKPITRRPGSVTGGSKGRSEKPCRPYCGYLLARRRAGRSSMAGRAAERCVLWLPGQSDDTHRPQASSGTAAPAEQRGGISKGDARWTFPCPRLIEGALNKHAQCDDILNRPEVHWLRQSSGQVCKCIAPCGFSAGTKPASTQPAISASVSAGSF